MRMVIVAIVLAAGLSGSSAQIAPVRIDASLPDSFEADSFLFAPWRTAESAASIGPRFKRSPRGWMPSCPAGMDLIRHNPPPDCFWGTAPMMRKPTMGDFECVDISQATKLPACPAEGNLSAQP